MNTIILFFRWIWVSTALVGFTLIFAALTITPQAGELVLTLTGKFFGVLLAALLLGWVLDRALTEEEVRDTL